MSGLSGAPKTYDWDALAREWADTRPQTLWRRHSDSVYGDLLRRWLPSPLHSVLKTDAFDEAVSAGVYPELARHARAVVAIDVAPTALTRARGRYADLLCTCTDVRRLPFSDGSFDAVVSLSTLDHFDSHADIGVALAELARVLRPGGTLILTLDNLANPIIALRAVMPFRFLHAAGVVPYQVGRTCGPRRLRRIVTRAGLEIIETCAVVHCPRVLAVALANSLDRTETSGSSKPSCERRRRWNACVPGPPASLPATSSRCTRSSRATQAADLPHARATSMR